MGVKFALGSILSSRTLKHEGNSKNNRFRLWGLNSLQNQFSLVGLSNLKIRSEVDASKLIGEGGVAESWGSIFRAGVF